MMCLMYWEGDWLLTEKPEGELVTHAVKNEVNKEASLFSL